MPQCFTRFAESPRRQSWQIPIRSEEIKRGRDAFHRVPNISLLTTNEKERRQKMGNATRSDFPADVFGFAGALRISQGTRWNASLPCKLNWSLDSLRLKRKAEPENLKPIT